MKEMKGIGDVARLAADDLFPGHEIVRVGVYERLFETGTQWTIEDVKPGQTPQDTVYELSAAGSEHFVEATQRDLIAPQLAEIWFVTYDNYATWRGNQTN